MIRQSSPTVGERPDLDKTPIVAGILLGFLASLCCGGSMIFVAIGLGVFYSSLQLSHYIPEALATGAILITLLNWLYYRHKAARMLTATGGYDRGSMRRAILVSGLIRVGENVCDFYLPRMAQSWRHSRRSFYGQSGKLGSADPWCT